MVSLLSEVLRLKKPPSGPVLEAIVEYVGENVTRIAPDEVEAITAHFRRVLEGGGEERDDMDYVCAAPDISALLRAVRTTQEIVAVLPSGVFGDDVGRKVLQVFASRVGLIGPKDPDAQELQVTLWFKDDLRARKWWFLIQEFLDEEAPEVSTADHVRDLIRACDAGRIKTLVVNPVATGAKVIVAAPRSPGESLGFSFNLSRGIGLVFLSSMGPEGTREWVEDVFVALDGVGKPVKAASCFLE